MYILVDLWFLFPNLCVSQLYVSSIVGAACGGLNEPEAWKLHALGLCLGVFTFTCTSPAFGLSKIIKNTTREKPGKSPRTPQESPGTPVKFFFDLDHSEVQRFFPFSDVCLCETAMETRETFEALLVGLKAEGVTPTAKALAEASGVSERKENEPHALKPTLVTQKNLR